MNSYIKDIIIPVNQLYSFLYLPVNLNFLQSAEFTDPMINMYNIISGIKPCKLFYRNAFFFVKYPLILNL